MWKGSDMGMRKEQQENREWKGSNKGPTRESEGKTKEWEERNKGAEREQ